MAIDPACANTLQNRLNTWIALGNDPGDAALVANVLGAASSLGDVMTNLIGKQQHCPPPPGFHVRAIAGAFHSVDDGKYVTVLGFSLTTSANPGHTTVHIF